MHILPFSTPCGQTHAVPLHDAAASRLADLWLMAPHDGRRPQTMELLGGEPSLTIWAACRYREMRGEPARGLRQIATWLDTERGATWTACHDLDDPPRISLTDDRVDCWRDLAASALAMAERAAELVPEPLRERAFLWGMFHRADAWCLRPESDPSTPKAIPQHDLRPNGPTADGSSLRSALGDATSMDETEWADLSLAIAQASGESPGSTPSPLTDRIIDRARAGWDSAGRYWSRGLEEIIRGLRQLGRWETRFQESLELEKLSALREFAYGASHEINNPLANISIRAQTLLRDECDPERRRKLATINSQAFRAHEMISDLMLFARPPMIDPQPIAIHALVDRIISELSEVAASHGVRLANMAAESGLVLLADATYLGVAIKSLCMNSLEAVGPEGSIEVDIQSIIDRGGDDDGTEWIEITVRDNGPGISDEVRPHIFDPYFSGREAGRGLGLGLSKCWRIVTLHGGRIRVERDERGTAFILRFPQPSSPPPRAASDQRLAESCREVQIVGSE